jgi:membrane-bound lytic murein transglycosylase B
VFIRFFSLGFRVAGMFSLLTSLSVIAQEPVISSSKASGPAASFQQCISELQDRALLSGVSQNVVTEVLGKARYREKIISLDRNQPEFVQTFTDYFTKRVTPWRLQKGQQMLAKHRDFLAKLTRQYGVPGTYLLAFWGLETNFGSYKGTSPVIDSLATLACDQRRSGYFSSELIQALLLLERETLQVNDMVGSWAGAMGQTQFMPSAYMKYAQDGDHDGQINLWSSEQDALASAANFLQHLGWQSGYKWGREVSLPEGFDYQLAGKDNSQSLSFWARQGITQTDGSALGAGELQGALLIPAGHQGPVFLAYQNFDVILGWNNSEYYAIAVGHLADRIAGKNPLSKDLPVLPNYTSSEMQQLQKKLNELGFDVGKTDGILGPDTRKGVRGYQLSQGMIADGYPAQKVFEAILMKPAQQTNDSQ